MVADLSHLVRLQKSQIKPAADVLARAFQDDPFNVYLLPDASERMNKLPHGFRMLVHYGVLYSELYATSPNLEGVAVWLPSEKVEHYRYSIIESRLYIMGNDSLRYVVSDAQIG